MQDCGSEDLGVRTIGIGRRTGIAVVPDNDDWSECDADPAFVVQASAVPDPRQRRLERVRCGPDAGRVEYLDQVGDKQWWLRRNRRESRR